MWYCHDGTSWWMVLWMVAFWGAIFALAVWGISRLIKHSKSEASTVHERSALDIAKERYARGEISREELEQIKKDLS